MTNFMSITQINRFQSLGVCSLATYAPSNVQVCYSSTQLLAVNPRAPMGGNPTAQTAVGDALCVVQQNNVQEVSDVDSSRYAILVMSDFDKSAP
jgi:hypothetical protein